MIDKYIAKFFSSYFYTLITRYIELISRRTLVLPSIFAFAGALFTYKEPMLGFCFSIGGAVICFLLAIFLLGIARLAKRQRDRNNLSSCCKCVFSMFLTAVLIIYVSFGIFSQYSKATAIYDESINKTFNVRITSVTTKLSGQVTILGTDIDTGVNYLLEQSYSLADLEALSTLKSGDVVSVSGWLRKIDPPRNPGEFDYREYMSSKGVYRILCCNQIAQISTGNAFYSMFKSIGQTIRQYIYSLISRTLDSMDSNYISALCLGDSSILEDEIKDKFSFSNCSHLLAVSGTHFSGFLVALPLIFNKTRLRKAQKLTIFSILAFSIGIVTGFSESVTRALVMSICSFALKDKYSSISIAAIIIMLANPFSCLSLGFQMSFSSVIGIIVITNRLNSLIPRENSNFITEGLFCMLGAQIGMLPFASETGFYISIQHIIVQIFGSLLVTIICIFAIPSILLSLLIGLSGFNSLLEAIYMPLVIPIRLLDYGINWCVESASYAINIKNFNKYILVGAIVVFLVFLFFRSVPRTIRKAILFTAFVFIVVGVLEVICRPQTKIVFIDVGQGDSALIISKDKTCLIDGGIEKCAENQILDVLNHYGINKLDYAVMTHIDSDHSGGILKLCEMGKIDLVMTSFLDSSRPYVEGMLFEIVSKGDVIWLSSDCFLEVISPVRASSCENEDSVVIMLRSGGTNVLFTGDIGFETEEAILVDRTDISCDILKLAHHGSRFSSSSDFLLATSAEAFVVSAGRFNNYGHPSPVTIERIHDTSNLLGIQTEIYSTIDEGAIIVDIYCEDYEIYGFSDLI